MSAPRTASRSQWRSSLGALALAALLGGATPAQEKPAQEKKTENARAAAAALAEDKGRFRILLDGQPMGSEEFAIAPSGKEWVARSTTEIRAPGGPATQVSARLTLLPDGTLLRYEWSTQGPKKASATVEFRGGTAKMALRIGSAEPFIQELSFGSPRVVVLDNNVYHHYAILARLYDWNAKGPQTLPVLIPQDMIPGSITVESAGTETVDGNQLELLRAHTPDLEVNLYLDTSHRLVRLTAPSAKAEVRRE